MSAVHGPTPCSAVSAACARSASILPTRVRSIFPLATALPISRIDLILGAERPSRLSLPARAERTGARGRELLSAYDGAQAGKARLAPAQAEFAGLVRNRLEPRIGADQLRQAGLQIGVGMKEMGHALSV